MANVVIENLSRDFGSFRAVDSLNLNIESGRFVTLLGPSGCGKTTTLRMLAGLVKNTEGRITIGDTVVSDASRGLFVPPEGRNLGMVFQSYAIWPHMTVFENVAYPLSIRRVPKATIREKVAAALEIVEMGHLANRPAPDLSGGQQQRVAIARALVFEPRVLLLDEPLSNLDARLRLQMGDEFRVLQQRLGITTVYVTHDQSEAMALSDDVVLMNSGRILQNSAPREMYLQPKSRDVATFFGTPNFIELTVQKATPRPEGDFTLDVAGAGGRGHCLSAFDPGEGGTVTVMLRPENFEILVPGEETQGMAWEGVVKSVTFRGQTQTVVVDTGAMELNIEAGPLVELNVGDQIHVGAALSAAWAVRDA